MIIHVDMDEFFAAVEKLDNPSLAGKCILVGGSPAGRGVVSTASYEARRFGCHSAMPMATAIRLCPHATVLPVRGERYREVSDGVFEIFERFTPMVEPLSIDEAFLDVSGCERLFGPADQIAGKIKEVIQDQLGLIASLGVAPNKFLAKLASDLQKPNGLVVITEQNVHDVLDPLPISKLWGVGPATLRLFEQLGIRTICQLRRMPVALLRERFGDAGEHFHRLANGLDDRPVTPDSQAKSVGQEQTFPVDLSELAELRRVLLQQAEHVARRLRRAHLKAKTVTIKLRYGDFETLTRARTLTEATNTTEGIWQAAEGLFSAWSSRAHRPLRLLGVTASGLTTEKGRQLNLFTEGAVRKQRSLDETLDKIVSHFGEDAIRRGQTS